jgi:DNA processing protein
MEEIKQIRIEDENYPRLLKKISNPPRILYYVGAFLDDELPFGVVGTRRCSPYGKQVTSLIVSDLVDAGFTIVSGLAPGIDTIAHKIAVEKNKRTIAVLGTGLDQASFYPKENIGLARKIVELDGCLISEYPPGTKGTNFTFPQRNRLISGLSLAVLVTEAKEKSGALITANWAFSQRRKVFAVPGPVYSSTSAGPNNLIKNGAKLVASANDILKEFSLFNLKCKMKSPSLSATPQDKKEYLILNALNQEPLSIDNILEKTKLDASIVSSTLALMEISGKVRDLGGGIYALTR